MHHRFSTFAFVIFAGVFVLAAVAFGGVHGSIKLAIAVGLSLSALFIMGGSVFKEKRIKLPLVAFLPIAGIVWGLVQMLPMPSGLVASLSPVSHGAYASAAAILGIDSVTMHLSPDPVATGHQGLSLLIASLAVFVGFFVARRDERIDSFFNVLLVTTLVVSGIGIVQHGIPLWQKLGFYSSDELPYPFFATLVNPNHASLLYALSSTLALAMFIRPTYKESGKPYHLLLSLWFAIWTVMVPSRGGVLTLFIGLVLVGLIRFVQQKRADRHQGRNPIILAVVVATVAATSLFVGFALVEREWSNLFPNKLLLYDEFLDMVEAFQWTGAGAGTTEVVYPLFGDSMTRALQYMENFEFQRLVDWGAAFGGTWLVALFGMVLYMVYKARHKWAAILGSLTVLIILIHDQFDFASELPVFSLLLWGSLGMISSQLPRRAWRPVVEVGRWVALGGLFVLLVGTFCLYGWSRGADGMETYKVVQQELLDGKSPSVGVDTLRGLLAEQPLDAHGWYVTAHVYKAEGDLEGAVPFAREAWNLRPDVYRHGYLYFYLLSKTGHPAEASEIFVDIAHRFPEHMVNLADAFLREPSLQGATKAMFEGHTKAFARFVPIIYSKKELGRKALPAVVAAIGSDPELSLVLAIHAFKARDKATISGLLDEALASNPDAPLTAFLFGVDQLLQGKHDKAWPFLLESFYLDTRMAKVIWSPLFDALVAAGETEEASNVLDTMAGFGSFDVHIKLKRASVALANGDHAKALILINEYLTLRPGSISGKAFRAKVLEAKGDELLAKDAYQELYMLTGKDEYKDKVKLLEGAIWGLP